MAHNRLMQEISPYTVHVRKDVNRPDRYRWDVYEIKKLRDSSMYSFTTKQEAQTDGELFVGKLMTTWQTPH